MKFAQLVLNFLKIKLKFLKMNEEFGKMEYLEDEGWESLADGQQDDTLTEKDKMSILDLRRTS